MSHGNTRTRHQSFMTTNPTLTSMPLCVAESLSSLPPPRSNLTGHVLLPRAPTLEFVMSRVQHQKKQHILRVLLNSFSFPPRRLIALSCGWPPFLLSFRPCRLWACMRAARTLMTPQPPNPTSHTNTRASSLRSRCCRYTNHPPPPRRRPPRNKSPSRCIGPLLMQQFGRHPQQWQRQPNRTCDAGRPAELTQHTATRCI